MSAQSIKQQSMTFTGTASARCCPQCRSSHIRRQHRRGAVQYLVSSLVGYYPYACDKCGLQFYRRRSTRPRRRPGWQRLVMLLGLFILCSGTPRDATAQVLFDNATSDSFTGSSTVTINDYLVGTGPNRFLAVGVSINTSSGVEVIGITVGGVVLIRKSSSSNGQIRLEVWRTPNNMQPPTGSQTITVMLSGAANVVVGVASFFGVNLSSPLVTSGFGSGAVGCSSSAMGVSVMSVSQSKFIFGVLAIPGNAGPVTVTSAMQTVRYNTSTGSTSSDVIGHGYTAPPNTDSQGWTWGASSNACWSWLGLIPAASGAVEVGSLFGQVVGQTVRLMWETVSEANIAGFLVWRRDRDDGPLVSLTDALIQAQASGTLAGAQYSFTDATLTHPGRYEYFLELVRLDGSTELMGPITVRVKLFPQDTTLQESVSDR